MTLICWVMDRSVYPFRYHAVMGSERLCVRKGDLGWDFKHFQPAPASGALASVCADCRMRFDQVLARNAQPRGKERKRA